LRKLSILIALVLVLSFSMVMAVPVGAASIVANDTTSQSVAVPLNTTNFPALIGAANMQQVGFGNGKASGNQMSTWESICVIGECFDLTAVDADPLWVKTGVGSICTVSDIIDGPLEVTRTTWDVGGSNNWLIEVVVSSLLPGSADEAGARIWVKANMDDLASPNLYHDISVRLMKEASNDDNFIGLYNQNGNLAQTSEGSDAKIVLRWDQHLPRYRISLMRQGDEIIMTAEPSIVFNVEDLLDFIDDSVVAGTLEGDGPGNSADNRLNAIKNMIEAASDLIDAGDTSRACQQLLDAYKKCDGAPKPPDFVSGPAASTLAGMIQQLRDNLGCSQE